MAVNDVLRRRRRRILIGLGAAGGITTAGVLLIRSAMAADPVGPPPPVEPPPPLDDPPPPPPPPADPEAQPDPGVGTNIPPRTSSPYNTTMFPSSAAVWGRLAGLHPRYTGLAGPPDGKGIAPAVELFQRDWNAAAQRGILPGSLAPSRFIVDGIPDPKFLRGLEWAVSPNLNWIQVISQL